MEEPQSEAAIPTSGIIDFTRSCTYPHCFQPKTLGSGVGSVRTLLQILSPFQNGDKKNDQDDHREPKGPEGASDQNNCGCPVDQDTAQWFLNQNQEP